MKNRVMVLVGWFLVVVLPGLGGEGNYRDYLVGDRAAGMGGAAVAQAISVEAAYYNPAGLPHTGRNEVALFATVYGFSNFQVRDGWDRGRDIDIDSVLVIPTAFGSVWSLDETWAVAFSIFVPRQEKANDLEAFPRQNEFYKYHKDDQTLWVGPSAGFRYSESVSFGVSLFGVYRTQTFFRDQLWADGTSYSTDLQYDDMSVLPLFGVQYQHDRNLSLGATLQPQSLHLTGSGEYLEKAVLPDGEVLVSYLDDAKSRNTTPARASIGGAYSQPGEWTVALDLIYHFPASYNRLEGDDQLGFRRLYPIKHNSVVDVSLGGEYYLAERYAVRAGLFTSYSSTPAFRPLDPRTTSYPPQIDKYGVSASIGREHESTTLHLGFSYTWGSGSFRGWDEEGQQMRARAKESHLALFVGSSYLF